MNMTSHIELPVELGRLLCCETQAYELRRNALLLYPFIKNKTISHGRAAEILGISKCALIDLYDKEGFSYFDLNIAEVNKDVETYQRLMGAKQQFDYTKWHRNMFDDMTLHELNTAAAEYAKKHPYTGKGMVI